MRWRLLLGAVSLCSLAAQAADTTGAIFFDDFSYADTSALLAHGWRAREKRGHPGVPGASWGRSAVAIVDDASQPGNRVLRLTARTDGTSEGTQQAQICHARKYFEGTYAARIRFTDDPLSGADGDPVIQTFYAVAPLRHDFDPEFSEFDWEYLPNGGWGAPETRLYGISWQTVQIEPWEAHNQLHQEFGSHAGWHVLMMQIANGRTRLFVDGRQIDEHGGRNYPVVPMAISFSEWFSPGGLLPASATSRVWEEDVDWVFHAKDRVMSPDEVLAAVAGLRKLGSARQDTVPEADPPLVSGCDF
jgi:hypothetical protein